MDIPGDHELLKIQRAFTVSVQQFKFRKEFLVFHKGDQRTSVSSPPSSLVLLIFLIITNITWNFTCMYVCEIASVMSSSWDSMDYSLTGFSVHEILQARILKWVAMPSSRGSSQSSHWTHVSCGSCNPILLQEDSLSPSHQGNMNLYLANA